MKKTNKIYIMINNKYDLENYAKIYKRENNYIEEAEEMFYSYYRKYNRIPPKKIFDEFFWIFESRKNVIEKEFDEKMKLCGNYFETKNQFYTSKGDFDNYEQFVEFCKNKYKIK